MRCSGLDSAAAAVGKNSCSYCCMSKIYFVCETGNESFGGKVLRQQTIQQTDDLVGCSADEKDGRTEVIRSSSVLGSHHKKQSKRTILS